MLTHNHHCVMCALPNLGGRFSLHLWIYNPAFPELAYNFLMDPNYHSPAAIFGRFRRTLLTDDQPFADELLARSNERLPDIRAEFEGDLMEYEMFLLAGLLANMQLIEDLKVRIRILSEKIESHSNSNSSNSSPP